MSAPPGPGPELSDADIVSLFRQQVALGHCSGGCGVCPSTPTGANADDSKERLLHAATLTLKEQLRREPGTVSLVHSMKHPAWHSNSCFLDSALTIAATVLQTCGECSNSPMGQLMETYNDLVLSDGNLKVASNIARAAIVGRCPFDPAATSALGGSASEYRNRTNNLGMGNLTATLKSIFEANAVGEESTVTWSGVSSGCRCSKTPAKVEKRETWAVHLYSDKGDVKPSDGFKEAKSSVYCDVCGTCGSFTLCPTLRRVVLVEVGPGISNGPDFVLEKEFEVNGDIYELVGIGVDLCRHFACVVKKRSEFYVGDDLAGKAINGSLDLVSLAGELTMQSIKKHFPHKQISVSILVYVKKATPNATDEEAAAASEAALIAEAAALAELAAAQKTFEAAVAQAAEEDEARKIMEAAARARDTIEAEAAAQVKEAEALKYAQAVALVEQVREAAATAEHEAASVKAAEAEKDRKAEEENARQALEAAAAQAREIIKVGGAAAGQLKLPADITAAPLARIFLRPQSVSDDANWVEMKSLLRELCLETESTIDVDLTSDVGDDDDEYTRQHERMLLIRRMEETSIALSSLPSVLNGDEFRFSIWNKNSCHVNTFLTCCFALFHHNYGGIFNSGGMGSVLRKSYDCWRAGADPNMISHLIRTLINGTHRLDKSSVLKGAGSGSLPLNIAAEFAIFFEQHGTAFDIGGFVDRTEVTALSVGSRTCPGCLSLKSAHSMMPVIIEVGMVSIDSANSAEVAFRTHFTYKQNCMSCGGTAQVETATARLPKVLFFQCGNGKFTADVGLPGNFVLQPTISAGGTEYMLIAMVLFSSSDKHYKSIVKLSPDKSTACTQDCSFYEVDDFFGKKSRTVAGSHILPAKFEGAISTDNVQKDGWVIVNLMYGRIPALSLVKPARCSGSLDEQPATSLGISASSVLPASSVFTTSLTVSSCMFSASTLGTTDCSTPVGSKHVSRGPRVEVPGLKAFQVIDSQKAEIQTTDSVGQSFITFQPPTESAVRLGSIFDVEAEDPTTDVSRDLESKKALFDQSDLPKGGSISGDVEATALLEKLRCFLHESTGDLEKFFENLLDGQPAATGRLLAYLEANNREAITKDRDCLGCELRNVGVAPLPPDIGDPDIGDQLHGMDEEGFEGSVLPENRRVPPGTRVLPSVIVEGAGGYVPFGSTVQALVTLRSDKPLSAGSFEQTLNRLVVEADRIVGCIERGECHGSFLDPCTRLRIGDDHPGHIIGLAAAAEAIHARVGITENTAADTYINGYRYALELGRKYCTVEKHRIPEGYANGPRSSTQFRTVKNRILEGLCVTRTMLMLFDESSGQNRIFGVLFPDIPSLSDDAMARMIPVLSSVVQRNSDIKSGLQSRCTQAPFSKESYEAIRCILPPSSRLALDGLLCALMNNSALKGLGFGDDKQKSSRLRFQELASVSTGLMTEASKIVAEKELLRGSSVKDRKKAINKAARSLAQARATLKDSTRGLRGALGRIRQLPGGEESLLEIVRSTCSVGYKADNSTPTFETIILNEQGVGGQQQRILQKVNE